jgi:hypothetical protein
MKIEKIISLASAPVRLRLLAMVRSLRATGCDLPVLVIPYDDEPESRFPLPEGCQWWEMPEVLAWAREIRAHPMVRKYQCFLTGNYQYVDSDVIFLRNPADVLAAATDFVASCGHWRNPAHTMTGQTEAIFRARSTNWQSRIFNAGQFACDCPLFESFAALRAAVEDPAHAASVLDPISEQPGINLLRLISGVPISNLTLPPVNMESTWAGDYLDADFRHYWVRPDGKSGSNGRQPYLIHWAGMPMDRELPIHELFYAQLSAAERAEWAAQVRRRAAAAVGWDRQLRRWKNRAKKAAEALQGKL